MERGKARPETAALVGGERERPKRMNRKGLSTVAVDAPADRFVVVVKPL
jgi:hypothetical protein